MKRVEKKFISNEKKIGTDLNGYGIISYHPVETLLTCVSAIGIIIIVATNIMKAVKLKERQEKICKV